MVNFFAYTLAATLTLALAVAIIFGAICMPPALRSGLLAALALESLAYVVSYSASGRRDDPEGHN